MAREHKVEENKVRGCQSQVWLYAELKEGALLFSADSDASIVKGLVCLLVHVYTDSTPEQVMEQGTEFLVDLGLSEHLSMSRANGLAAMVKQIKIYAFAFKTKIDMGLI